MKQPSQAFARTGFTLIEVIASIALLSTMLVGLLILHNKHSRQVQFARDKLVAVELADQLIGGWFQSANEIPLVGRGEFSGQRSFYWTTSNRAAQTDNPRWQSMVVSVDVWKKKRSAPLVSIDLLVSPQDNPIELAR